MFKSIDPKHTIEWFSPQHPDTVFTVRAFTGVHMAFTSDSVYNQAVNECIVSVTNFAAHIPVLGKDGLPEKGEDGKLTGKTELKEFDVFKPSEHPTVKMSAVLPHSMASGVFSAIWSLSTLSKQEAGE